MKILKLKNHSTVTKNTSLRLQTNRKKIKELENIKAMFELGRIVDGIPYTLSDVWVVYNESVADEQTELLFKSTI